MPAWGNNAMNVSLSWPGKHLPPAPPPANLSLTETFEPLRAPLTINNSK